jgi:hypothetical protein
VFRGDRCYEHFVELMKKVVERFAVRVHAGTDTYGAVSKAVRRMTARLKKDKQMQKVAEEVANCLCGQT